MSELLIILLVAGPAAIGQTYFVYRYFRYSTWRRDRIGRALFVKSSALALLVDAALLSELVYFFVGPGSLANATELLEIWVYFVATIAIWWQLIVLLKVQKAEKRRKKAQQA